MDKFHIEQTILRLQSELNQLNEGLFKIIGNRACTGLIMRRKNQIISELKALREDIRRM